MKTAYITAQYDDENNLRGYHCKYELGLLTLAKDCAIFYPSIEECRFKDNQLFSFKDKNGNIKNGYWKIEHVLISDDPDYWTNRLKYDT